MTTSLGGHPIHFEIRELTVPDPLAEQALHFLYETLEGHEPKPQAIVEAYSNDTIHGAISSNGSLEGAIAAESQLGRGSATYTYIDALAVRMQARRRGCGRLLIAAAIEQANERGDQSVRLHATPNSAIFYYRLGFKAIGAPSLTQHIYMERPNTLGNPADMR